MLFWIPFFHKWLTGPACQWDFQGPPIMGPLTHNVPIKIPKDMGMVWEAYHKEVPLLGVPGITLEPASILCAIDG